MNNIFLICLIIAFSVVYIWDYVNFPEEFVNRILTLILKKSVHITLAKPFGCSLCMTTWTTLIVLLCVNPAFCWMSLIYGWSTKYILYFINITDKLISNLFMTIERFLDLKRQKTTLY